MDLLAPCGSFSSLRTAVGMECDSIYFGIEHLNMRSRSARNFRTDDMKEISKICKDNKVKSYLTLNTLLYDHDISMVNKILDKAKESEIDGAIVSDVAGLMHAHQIGLSVSCSTQLSISNIESIRFYSQFADIIVLARELDLKMIGKITNEIEKQQIKGPSGELIKIEIFGHGAMCIAQSGRCSMSLYQRNASANRGACLQPCRAKYKVINEETQEEMVIDNGYVMSPKDLSTIGILREVMDAGVKILKIEGRGRDPLYVKRVIQTYREALDLLKKGDVEAYNKNIKNYHEKLGTVYNRGMSNGYYLGREMLEISGLYGSASIDEKQYIGKIKHYYSRAKVAEVDVLAKEIKKLDKYVIIGDTSGVIEGCVDEIRDNGTEVKTVKKGGIATFKINGVVRKNDRVFVLKERHLKVDQN